MINIAIPSYQRPNNVLTLNNIPLSYKDNTYLFVRPEEYELYKHYETQAKIVQLKNCTNIGDTRQYIAEYFDGKKMWMLDDDIKIFNSFYNQEKDIIRTDKNTIDEIQFYECISYIEQILEHHYHGNLRFRIFPRGKSYWPYKINTYGYTNTFLNLEKDQFFQVFPGFNERLLGYVLGLGIAFNIGFGKKEHLFKIALN